MNVLKSELRDVITEVCEDYLLNTDFEAKINNLVEDVLDKAQARLAIQDDESDMYDEDSL